MNQNHLEIFLTRWAGVLESYGKPVTEIGLEIVRDTLGDLLFEDANNALMNHVKSSKFMPTPANILELINGDPDNRALKAWSKVERSIGSVGGDKTVVFDEIEIMVAIDEMGGWIKLCSSKIDETPFLRNEFVKRYKGLCLKPSDSHPNKLIGRVEANNAQWPDKIPKPVLIGEANKAAEIHQIGFAGERLSVTPIEALQKAPDFLKVVP